MKHWRYKLFLAVALLSLWPLGLVLDLRHAAMAAFDAGALIFALTCVPLWLHGKAEVIRKEAARDDANELLLLLLTGIIGAAIMVSLVSLVTHKDVISPGMTGLLVATLLLSWLFTNLIFTFHYARLYYGSIDGAGDPEGIDGDRRDFGGLGFPGHHDPEFADFVNFAFVIGMTSQTADINITHPKVRRIATWHGFYAFAFNLGILALAVNALAGG
jgi:uncharacterized membrane protein